MDDVSSINLRSPNPIWCANKIPATLLCKSTPVAAVCGREKVLYVTGIGKRQDQIWRRDRSVWSRCGLIDQGRSRHCAAFVGEILYVFGGVDFFDDRRTLKSVEAYSSTTDECTKVGRLERAVQSAASVVYENSIYIFGGLVKSDTKVDYVQVYNTIDKKCRLLARPTPRPCSHMRAVLWQKFAILLGSDTCFVFDFETEIWQERSRFKSGVRCFGLVIDIERLFVVGGEDQETVGVAGKTDSKCTDKIKFVPVMNIIHDEPIEWKLHARLFRPSQIHAYGLVQMPDSC